jgi:Derlin-2/3
MISLSYYIFFVDYIFTIKQVPQVWRLFTSFLITKPKFAILLDPYFLYQYGSGLERESTRFSRPGDFFVYTGFLCSVILVSCCALSFLLFLQSFLLPQNHLDISARLAFMVA